MCEIKDDLELSKIVALRLVHLEDYLLKLVRKIEVECGIVVLDEELENL